MEDLLPDALHTGRIGESCSLRRHLFLHGTRWPDAPGRRFRRVPCFPRQRPPALDKGGAQSPKERFVYAVSVEAWLTSVQDMVRDLSWFLQQMHLTDLFGED